MAKKLKRPVKELANYAEKFGKWLTKHEDESGKVLTKNLTLEEQGYKREHEHFIEDRSFNLDVALSKKPAAQGDGKTVKQEVKKVEVDTQYRDLMQRFEKLFLQAAQNNKSRQYSFLEEVLSPAEREAMDQAIAPKAPDFIAHHRQFAKEHGIDHGNTESRQ